MDTVITVLINMPIQLALSASQSEDMSLCQLPCQSNSIKNTLCPSPAPVCVHVSMVWPWIIQQIFTRLSAFVCPDLPVLAACHHPLFTIKSASRNTGQKKKISWSKYSAHAC